MEETKKIFEPITPEVIICACGSYEHQLVIIKDEDFSDNYKEVILGPHLVTHKNIFKRIWTAIKYVAGYKSRYGQWDNIIITKDNYLPLKKAVEFLDK